MMRATALAALTAASIAAGCGGIVVVDNSGGATSSSKSSASSMKTSTASATTSGSGMGCAGLGEVACLGAAPDCVPIYDDTCCSTCNPGPCADCIKYQFHHCATHTDACGKPKPACGVIAPGGCSGITPKCSNPYCPANPGCVAGCLPDAAGGCAPECLPVTKGSCTSTCAQPSPTCPSGYVAERDGGCFTGHCIAASTCPG